MFVFNYRRRGHESATPIERKIGVCRRWEDFCSEIVKITGWPMETLDGLDLTGLKAKIAVWNEGHITEENEEPVVWQRLLVEEVGAQYVWELEPSDHTAFFIGENRYDLLRKIKEFIKKEEGLQELYEIRKDDNSGDTLFRAAINLLSRDYHTDVSNFADYMIEAMLSDEVNDDESFSTRMTENVGGAQRVFVTVQAQACLLVSNNDGRGVEDGLVPPECFGLVPPECFKEGIPWDSLAHCTFEADIKEELDRREKVEFSDKETEDPLERYCDWEIVEEERPAEAPEPLLVDGEVPDLENDGIVNVPPEMETVEVEVCTIEYSGKTYTGRGSDREDALADLRKNYAAT